MQDPLQQVLDETRQRFVATFPAECDTLRVLVERVAELGPEGPVAPLAHAVPPASMPRAIRWSA